jgi:hypothetical protein
MHAMLATALADRLLLSLLLPCTDIHLAVATALLLPPAQLLMLFTLLSQVALSARVVSHLGAETA